MPTNYTVCRGDVLSKVTLVQCPFTKEDRGVPSGVGGGRVRVGCRAVHVHKSRSVPVGNQKVGLSPQPELVGGWARRP